MYFYRPPGCFPGSFLRNGGIAIYGPRGPKHSTVPNAAIEALQAYAYQTSARLGEGGAKSKRNGVRASQVDTVRSLLESDGWDTVLNIKTSKHCEAPRSVRFGEALGIDRPKQIECK